MVDVTVPGTGQTVPDDEQVDTAGRSRGLVWHSRTQRAAPPGTIFFAGGVPDPVEYPLGTLTEIIGGVLREDDAEGMTYAPEHGYLPLREVIAGRHAGRDGLAVDPGQVTITNGTAGALVLAGNAFLEPGDVVISERLTYHGAMLAFQLLGAEVIGAPMDGEGLRADALEELLTDLQTAGRRVKLIYTIPGCQGVTGALMGDERRAQIAELARRFGAVLLYDDTYGELRYEDGFPPSLLTYAPERTIHMGSFSKTVAPGLRVGWMTAPSNIIATISKVRTDLGTTPINQRLVAHFIEEGYYDAHLDHVNPIYRVKRDTLVAALEEHCAPYCTWTVPPGGFFIWLQLPGATVPELETAGLEERVAFLSGRNFSVGGADETGFRLAYGQLSLDDLNEGAARLGRALARHTEGSPS
jgi:DNA-binding transcriptional MocR family regulator